LDPLKESPEITVRRAVRADSAAIVGFNLSMAAETEGKTLSAGLLTSGVAAVFDDPSKGFYVIAEDGGRPVGGLLVTAEWSDWRNAYFWWIQSVYVDPASRKRGVYGCLHRWVENAARAAGNVCGLRLYVDADNAAARSVYERMGMSRSRYDFFESLPRTGGGRGKDD
jgi:GNAT superfamily N-acetyltransferase